MRMVKVMMLIEVIVMSQIAVLGTQLLFFDLRQSTEFLLSSVVDPNTLNFLIRIQDFGRIWIRIQGYFTILKDRLFYLKQYFFNNRIRTKCHLKKCVIRIVNLYLKSYSYPIFTCVDPEPDSS